MVQSRRAGYRPPRCRAELRNDERLALLVAADGVAPLDATRGRLGFFAAVIPLATWSATDAKRNHTSTAGCSGPNKEEIVTPRLAFAGINLSKSGGEHGAAPRHCSYEGARPAIYQMCDPGPVLSIIGVAALLPPAPRPRFDGTLRQVVRGRQRWPRAKLC